MNLSTFVHSSPPLVFTNSEDTIQMEGPEVKNAQPSMLNDSPKKKASKRGRPRKRAADNAIERTAANARERRRMNRLNDAYMALKNVLPMKDEITSKKQIIDQVSL